MFPVNMVSPLSLMLNAFTCNVYNFQFLQNFIFCFKTKSTFTFISLEPTTVLFINEFSHLTLNSQKRGAEIYAEFLGGSLTCDAYHMTEPRPDGNPR